MNESGTRDTVFVMSTVSKKVIMNAVQVEQNSYEMPPREGFTVTDFITVADIDRSADFFEKVFGGRILSGGDCKCASVHIQIANTWLIVNGDGGRTPDKPEAVLETLPNLDRVSSFLNLRVADIWDCYKKWGDERTFFITEPLPNPDGWEWRC